MKKRTYWMMVKFDDGTCLKPVIRNTEKGQSDYANRMYRKYEEKGLGDHITVEKYHFDDALNVVTDATWHA